MRLLLPILAVVAAGCCACRIPSGQAGAYSHVLCGSVVTAELPHPARCFEVELLKKSDGRLTVEIWCEGESKPWTKTLQPGEKACRCCEGEKPRIRKVVLRAEGEGWCTYCATTRDSCP
jgi:hypothetical protein